MSIEPYIEDKITSIKDDTTHGASELARQALDTLQLAASESNTDDPDQFLSEFNEISNRLVSVHPAMAPIYNMVKRLQAGLADYKNSDASILKKAAINLADELIRSSVNAAAKIAGYATELIANKETIMTHSYS
jgi:translation initiation factor 2B subunit (eIF-2B alpha/beta/delta family)